LKELGLDEGCNIENEILKRKQDLDIHNLRKIKEKINTVNKKLFVLENKNTFTNGTSADVASGNDGRCASSLASSWIKEEEMPAKILEYKLLLEGVSCPNCNCLLKYDSSINKITLLQTFSHTSENSEQTAHDLFNLIEQSKIRNELMRQRKILEDECCVLKADMKRNIDDFPVQDEDKIYKDISLLQSLPKLSNDVSLPVLSYRDLFLSKTKWKARQIEQSLMDLSFQTRTFESVIEIEDKLKKLSHLRTKIELYISICSDIRNISNKISDNMEEFSIEETMEKLNECREIQKFIICSKKIESETEGKSIEDLRENYASMIKEKEARECLENIERSEEIIHLQDEMAILFEDPEQIKALIEKEKEQRNKRRDQVEISDEISKLLNEKKKLVLLREEVVQLENKVVGLSKIKMVAKELEHKRIISTLQTIGDFTNDVLCMLFDEPIKIDFDVFKTSKTSKTTKPSINYKILYKGHEIDSIDQMSGGEADRVSLAVSCALFKFSNFPFLILDEFASSLDLNNKEASISGLKTFLGTVESKSILCISHDTVEGMYDHHLILATKHL